MGKKTNGNEKVLKIKEHKKEIIIKPNGIMRIIETHKVEEYK